MSIDPEIGGPITFNDLPPDDALKWQRQFSQHSLPSYQGRLTYPGYKYVPVTYMFTERDLILWPEIQQMMISNMEAAGAKVNVIKYNTGHVPHASDPDAVVDVVKKALGL
jgi:pimeloyl-ACP methyl ester carboxylesterase